MSPASVSVAGAGDRPLWDFVAGRSFLAALAAPAADETLQRLLALVDVPDVPVESLVGAIPVGGAGAPASFAVVVFDDEERLRRVTAVVRGRAIAELHSPGGSRRFDDRGIQPWLLAAFGDVDAIVLTDAGEPLGGGAVAGEQLPGGRGRARGTRLDWLAMRAEAARGAGEGADDDTLAGSPASRLHAEQDTVLHPPRPVPEPRDSEDAREQAGSATGDEGPPTASPAALFRIGDGEPYTLDRPALIGRSPRPPRVVQGPEPSLIAVASPSSAVSGTHLELRTAGSAVVATDLRSTNGTIIVDQAGRPQRLRQGESRIVAAGVRIDIGDGAIVEILPAIDVRDGRDGANRTAGDRTATNRGSAE